MTHSLCQSGPVLSAYCAAVRFPSVGAGAPCTCIGDLILLRRFRISSRFSFSCSTKNIASGSRGLSAPSWKGGLPGRSVALRLGRFDLMTNFMGIC